MIRLDLYAAGTDELLASVPVPGAAEVNVAKRIVAGLAVPWNLLGTPSTGPTIFRASSVTPPAQLEWVKLLEEHDPNRSLGYMRDAVDTAAGLLAAFQVADGPAGDAALAAAAAKTRDAFSVRVEVDAWGELPGGVLEIRSSRLRETSLVAVPAYATARASVLASLPSNERERVMTELRRMLDVKASAPAGEPAPAPAAPAAAPAPVLAAAPATPPASAAPATTSPVTPPLDLANLAAALAPYFAAAGGSRPAGEPQAAPPNGAPARTSIPTVRAAAEAVARWQRDGSGNVGVLLAALNDVVPANDAGGASSAGDGGRPQWLGELWTASQTARPFVDALGTPKPLTAMKAKGWRWVTKPVVGDYAGDKAAIPSNAVSTEPAEADAHRVAGGWDVDRVFVDLGDADMLTALFEAATEDYRKKSNAWLGAQLVAAAGTTAVVATTLVEALVAMGAAAGGIGARVSWLAVASDVYGDFAGLTRDQVPWWLGAGDGLNLGASEGNAGGFKFWADTSLAAGTFIGGDQRAATYYEQGAVPIKVQALNIPNGGIDLGVFGYNAMIVNDARAIYKGDLGAGA